MLQEAKDSYSSKFDSPFTAWLSDQMPDDSTGQVDSFGWYGLYGRSILVEDSQGFVSRTRYASALDARETFDETAEEWAAYAEECDILVTIDGPPSGEYVRECACGRPIYRSHMAGTIYHASDL